MFRPRAPDQGLSNFFGDFHVPVDAEFLIEVIPFFMKVGKLTLLLDDFTVKGGESISAIKLNFIVYRRNDFNAFGFRVEVHKLDVGRRPT